MNKYSGKKHLTSSFFKNLKAKQIHPVIQFSETQRLFFWKSHTVTYTESGTPMLNWDSRYLCHFSTEMAEIWSPGTSFQDVWTCKISALYLLYFHSYESFCGVFSDFH